jgi:hypothetical protein
MLPRQPLGAGRSSTMHPRKIRSRSIIRQLLLITACHGSQPESVLQHHLSPKFAFPLKHTTAPARSLRIFEEANRSSSPAELIRADISYFIMLTNALYFYLAFMRNESVLSSLIRLPSSNTIATSTSSVFRTLSDFIARSRGLCRYLGLHRPARRSSPRAPRRAASAGVLRVASVRPWRSLPRRGEF